jgi:HSP20 family protein
MDKKGGGMVLARWSLLRSFMSVCDAVDRLFRAIRRIGEAKGEGWRSSSWSPAVDIYETDDAVIVKAELPGFAREDVRIEIKQHALLLGGSRPHDREVDADHYHCMERMSGAFQRFFLLPTRIDSEKVSASCHNGLLTLRLAKAMDQIAISHPFLTPSDAGVMPQPRVTSSHRSTNSCSKGSRRWLAWSGHTC